MLSPAEAEQLIRQHTPRWADEACPLFAAQGRILRQALCADRDLPPYDRVTLDGYAVRFADLAALKTRFRVVGLQAAGSTPTTLPANEEALCIEVMTGAVLPAGADCVVPYEATNRDAESMELLPSEERQAYAPGHAIHRRGSDFSAGAALVPEGARLGGREVAIAASCGCSTLRVTASPRIVILSTGDELVDPGLPVAAWQVRRSNDYALRASLEASGFRDIECRHERDVPAELRTSLEELLEMKDFVIATGGVSQGKFDYLPSLFERLGVQKIFHGIAQRPGKPMWFGVSRKGVPVFALPGNPVSAFTCLHRYVIPALDEASGAHYREPLLVPLEQGFRFQPKMTYFLPGKLVSTSEGLQSLRPVPVNTSGDFARLIATDGFVELPADMSEFAPGFLTAFRPWF